MDSKKTEQLKIRVDQGGFVVILGVWAWLFTIGFLHLTFWKGVLAILLWPYYLGIAFSSLPH
jgi:hypothetical protein